MEKQQMTELRLQRAPEGFNPMESQRMLQKDIRTRMARLGLDVPVNDEPAETAGELAEIVIANSVALHQEIAELIDWLPWKWWKNYGSDLDEEPTEEQLTELKFELIDIQHFVYNIAIALGMDQEEFLDFFYTKQQENRSRQERDY